MPEAYELTREDHMLIAACKAAELWDLPVYPSLFYHLIPLIREFYPNARRIRNFRTLSIQQLHRSLKKLVVKGELEDLGVLDEIHLYWPTRSGFDLVNYWFSQKMETYWTMERKPVTSSRVGLLT